MKKYFYKEGRYTEKSHHLTLSHYGWNLNSWIQTGKEIEVSEDFYYNFLLPDEKRIVEQLKSKNISRDFHHQPFIKTL